MKISKLVLYNLIMMIMGICIFFIVKSCLNDPEESSGDYHWEYINTSTPTVIHPDTIEAALDSLEVVEISDITAWTAAEDTVHIEVYVHPETQEVIISGEVNGNPIIGADVEVIHPSIDIPPMEETGDVALLLDRAFREENRYSVGASWEPLHFFDGKLRIGLAGTVDIAEFNAGTAGARIAGRWRNLSAGVMYGARFDETGAEKQLSVNVGFYL
ncbi:MAG: hypothetical protein KAU20_07670 [Nanoarchaeota archaeon]|nr:hypothetical protein [Nanoarchaeota archaeon]